MVKEKLIPYNDYSNSFRKLELEKMSKKQFIFLVTYLIFLTTASLYPELWINIPFVNIAITISWCVFLAFWIISIAEMKLRLEDFSIILKIKMKHPEKNFGGDVYKIDLYSITPDIIVYTNLTKEENICSANAKVVTTVMVQNTINNCWYREITTGRLIPKVEVIKRTYSTEYKNFKYPVYALLTTRISPFTDDLVGNYKRNEVDFESISIYKKEREGEYEGYSSYSEYLENIFSSGEEFYKNAKKDISDDEKTRELFSA